MRHEKHLIQRIFVSLCFIFSLFTFGTAISNYTFNYMDYYADQLYASDCKYMNIDTNVTDLYSLEITMNSKIKDLNPLLYGNTYNMYISSHGISSKFAYTITGLPDYITVKKSIFDGTIGSKKFPRDTIEYMAISDILLNNMIRYGYSINGDSKIAPNTITEDNILGTKFSATYYGKEYTLIISSIIHIEEGTITNTDQELFNFLLLDYNVPTYPPYTITNQFVLMETPKTKQQAKAITECFYQSFQARWPLKYPTRRANYEYIHIGNINLIISAIFFGLGLFMYVFYLIFDHRDIKKISDLKWLLRNLGCWLIFDCVASLILFLVVHFTYLYFIALPWILPCFLILLIPTLLYLCTFIYLAKPFVNITFKKERD